MSENMKIYNAVREVPESAKRPIQGGKLKGKTDINPTWRIKVLTEQFGACGFGWYYKVTNKWTEQVGDEVAVFVDIELYIKVDGEWSMPILGTGGNMLASKTKNGIEVSDECYKMATTDALSVACKQLGIGADVYWEGDKTKYTSKETEPDKPFEDKKPDDRLTPVYAELKRTGYSEKAICKTYKIESIDKMSNLQIKDFLEKIKGVPTKEA